MFIQTEATPNPSTLKFLPGETVADNGPFEFVDAKDATERSPLAEALFSVPSVTGVFFGFDFITITKSDDVEWQHIKPAVLGVIMEHFVSGNPVNAEYLEGLFDQMVEGDLVDGAVAFAQGIADVRPLPKLSAKRVFAFKQSSRVSIPI